VPQPQPGTIDPNKEKKQPTPEQCDGLRTLLNREKKYGTFLASVDSSNMFGFHTIRSLLSPYGNIFVKGAELDIDYLIHLNATPKNLVDFSSASGTEAVKYAVGKVVNITGQYLLGERNFTNPVPFTDPGEKTAIIFSALNLRYSAIFTDEWMKANCSKKPSQIKK
jgi:hypothetical protein